MCDICTQYKLPKMYLPDYELLKREEEKKEQILSTKQTQMNMILNKQEMKLFISAIEKAKGKKIHLEQLMEDDDPLKAPKEQSNLQEINKSQEKKKMELELF